MHPLVQSLGIDRLSTQERIELAEAIWETIDADLDATPLTEAQQREVDRRLEAHRRNPEAAVAWEEIEAETRRRLGQ